ncbi:MAG TPA: BatA domain-containing protein, partial [Planctomycetota bacterium]|nr:BatA domain-containing protein [Planctomycetota bacterium]
MNFLWPYALAALIGVPAAVLIALWRARRREVPVASLLLWQSLARKLADSGRKRRTVLDLPLVLAAVSALLLGIAAAGPVLS